ncbi:UNVERIFIED_CONTAM: hypothetical protein GTU68_009668 [Idotea baltica]|nr:hypothetical protein [Idotea baltica]
MPGINGVLGCQAVIELSPIPAVSSVLPWHLDTWSQLIKQLDNDKLPHALLLVGERFSGKEQLALALARVLLCHSPSEGLNCGHCRGCELSRMGSHGDFRQLHPEAPSRVIKVDQVRELVEFAGKTASLGQRKVILISPADSMTTQAANALLKSLEEPASDTHMVLVSHRLQGLPATIRSRCQTLKFVMPTRSQSITWLDSFTQSQTDSIKALDLTRGKVMLAAQLCESAELDAAELLDSTFGQLFTTGGTLLQLDKLMSEQGLGEMLAQVQLYLQEHLRNMDRATLVGERGRAGFALMDQVVQLQRAVFSGANPNRQLLVDTLGTYFDSQLGAA